MSSQQILHVNATDVKWKLNFKHVLGIKWTDLGKKASWLKCKFSHKKIGKENFNADVNRPEQYKKQHITNIYTRIIIRKFFYIIYPPTFSVLCISNIFGNAILLPAM